MIDKQVAKKRLAKAIDDLAIYREQTAHRSTYNAKIDQELEGRVRKAQDDLTDDEIQVEEEEQ